MASYGLIATRQTYSDSMVWVFCGIECSGCCVVLYPDLLLPQAKRQCYF